MQEIDDLTLHYFQPQSLFSALTSLSERVDELDLALFHWHDSYQQQGNDMMDDRGHYWTSTAVPTASTPAMSPLIEFAGMVHAINMMTYWTYRLELSMIREDINALQASVDFNGLRIASETDSYRLASLIIRSTPYWLQLEDTGVSAYGCGMVFPYRVAWAWFARCPQLHGKELSACRTVRALMKTGTSATRLSELTMDQLYKPAPE